MEIDLQPIFMAKSVSQEKLRDKKRESVRLEHSSGLVELLEELVRVFR